MFPRSDLIHLSNLLNVYLVIDGVITCKIQAYCNNLKYRIKIALTSSGFQQFFDGHAELRF